MNRAQSAGRGIVRLRAGPIVLVAGVLAAAAACSSGSSDTAGRSAPSTSAPASHHATEPVTTAAPKASPKQLRAKFEQLLGQHALLAVRSMRSVVSSPAELQQAATTAIQGNTDALSQLVASAYGSGQSDRFKQLWQKHITDLSSYAKGAGGNDESAKQAARAALVADGDAYGTWLADASDGRVSKRDAVAAVRKHVEELMKQIDAYAARDYREAYRIERDAYEHMFTAGAAFAKGSMRPELAVGLDAPPEKLRSAFAMLLGEHMELVIEAQRATFAGAPEFQAAADQINANTTALTKGMGAIVGPKKAAEFQSAWAHHVEGLMDHSAAVAAEDEAAKATAEKDLDGGANRLALFFSDIVQNELPVEPLTTAITMHDTHLIGHVDAFAAHDYDQAQQMEREGYEQMLSVANTLVGAIQKTVKPGLPLGGSQTGGGGTAHHSG
jgi:hypothetical protein